MGCGAQFLNKVPSSARVGWGAELPQKVKSDTHVGLCCATTTIGTNLCICGYLVPKLNKLFQAKQVWARGAPFIHMVQYSTGVGFVVHNLRKLKEALHVGACFQQLANLVKGYASGRLLCIK